VSEGVSEGGCMGVREYLSESDGVAVDAVDSFDEVVCFIDNHNVAL